ncbi:sas10 utp3 c1d family protein [Diplodia corticola]|uniref:Sas10 utp3 c1d family protein n=1 Tax=Diplodia corticola TaxID=236234 RepID=A0A1J9QPZ4_9PEZI|nr:sas10 utp3 c1d family protein [Diplodia corticola]OJD30529.1 sas10 utp3 c1d family protein [Diplodia corticola]
MAAAKLDTSLPSLLSNLTASLTSAAEPVPSLNNNSADGDDDNDASSFSPLLPKDGISLLDVKNELLLSYLQNLVFLILLKLRNNKATSDSGNKDEGDKENVEDVVKKLCELRLYLEKGARPLEGKLKYQIDKVVRAADDAARAEEEALKKSKSSSSSTGKKKKTAAEDDGSGSDSDAASDSASDSDPAASASDIDELAYRPNPLGFARRNGGSSSSARNNDAAGSAADKQSRRKKGEDDASAIYRPPRITATSMPSDLPRHGREKQQEDDRRHPRRAGAIDDFVAEHLSAAPVAQPSIGSNVVDGGRRVASARDRAAEAERRAYEETNFVRLPAVGKKERAKAKAARDRGRSEYGGEEWRELGAGVERIDRLTRKGGERGGSTRGALERSRKRAVEDGPRGDGGGGAEAGAMFAKRRKVVNRRR